MARAAKLLREMNLSDLVPSDIFACVKKSPSRSMALIQESLKLKKIFLIDLADTLSDGGYESPRSLMSLYRWVRSNRIVVPDALLDLIISKCTPEQLALHTKYNLTHSKVPIEDKIINKLLDKNSVYSRYSSPFIWVVTELIQRHYILPEDPLETLLFTLPHKIEPSRYYFTTQMELLGYIKSIARSPYLGMGHGDHDRWKQYYTEVFKRFEEKHPFLHGWR